MAMPSLMAVCWVGQNFGPILCRLWTKVHRIKFACVRSLQRRFPIDDVLLRSGDIREVVRNRAKILMFLGRQISGGTGHPNF